MVGPPKTLYDLRKVEAAVRITCRSCQKVTTLDREELIQLRAAHRSSLDWRLTQVDLQGWCCVGGSARVDAVPFAEGNPEMRARRAATRRMNIALQVLAEGAKRDSAMPTLAIQLALRVLHPYVADQALLVTYWEQVSAEKDQPWGGGDQALRWIVTRLVERRWSVWAEFR